MFISCDFNGKICLISFADDTVLTVFASSVKELVRKSECCIRKAGDFYFIKLIVCKCVQDIFNDVLWSWYTAGCVWPGNFHVRNQFNKLNRLRYLGFYLACHLSWKCHSDNIWSKIARGVDIIRRLQHFLLQRVFLTIYLSLIYPNISYSCLLWSGNFLCT